MFILIEWMQALVSYQDYHMLLLAPAGPKNLTVTQPVERIPMWHRASGGESPPALLT